MNDKIEINFDKIEVNLDDASTPQPERQRLVVGKDDLPELKKKQDRKRVVIRPSHLTDEKDPFIADQLSRKPLMSRLQDSVAFQLIVGVIAAAILALFVLCFGDDL